MLEVRQIDGDGTPSIVVTDGVSTVFITENDLAQKDCIRVHVDYPYFLGTLIHTIKAPIVLEEGKVYRWDGEDDFNLKKNMIVQRVDTNSKVVYQYYTDNAPILYGHNVWLNTMNQTAGRLPKGDYKILSLGE